LTEAAVFVPPAGVVLVTLAVLVPLFPASPTTVKGIAKLLEVKPLFKAPTVQVTAWPIAEHPPGNVPIEKSEETVSVIVTPVAFCGPWFVAERVSVTASPVAYEVMPVAAETMVLLARMSVPGLTVTTAWEGPLFPATGSPVLPSVVTTDAPLVMLPAEVMTRPVRVISGAELPDDISAPE
jgi:hypothetical protein